MSDIWVQGGDPPAEGYDWNDRRNRRQPPRTTPAQPVSQGGTGYGRAALAHEVKAVASAEKGTRNDTLNRAAYNLGQLVAGGALEELDVEAQLSAAAASAGLHQAETRATILSGLTAGKQEPRQAPPQPDQQLVGANGHQLQRSPLVEDQLRLMRARAEARRILTAEQREPLPPIDVGTLEDVLGRPPKPPNRVDELIPWQASTLLTAQRKTGKTTLVLNLARALLTGEDFLGRFPVRPLDGAVAMLNYEVSAEQLARWARDVGVPAARLYLVNVRGRRNPLDDPDDRQALAATLRWAGIEVLIVDPFGRAYSGTSQNDAGEVGGWLTRLDQWARGDVGALDLVLTAHAGWNGERTRGSTALEDWADSIITLTRDDTEDAGGERYLRAIGRDVDLEEDRLSFDVDTRRLRLAGAGSRREAVTQRRASELAAAVLRIVATRPGANGSSVERDLREAGVSFRKGEERKALAALVETGRLTCQHGSNNAKMYSLASVSPVSPTLPVTHPGTLPAPPLRGGGGTQGAEGAVSPPGRLCLACGLPMTADDDSITHPSCDQAAR